MLSDSEIKVLIRRVQMRHLRCFLETARRRSVAAAAEHLGLGQPAVSKALSEFEALVGHALLRRSRRGSELTPAGAALLPRVAACLAELSRGLEAAAGLEDAADPVVRVGALPTVAARIAPRAVQRFRDRGDRATVRLLTGPNLQILDMLRDDRLDLVIGRLAAPEAMTGLAFEHLYSEAVRFVVRPDHPLRAGGPAAAERLERHPFIIPDREAVIRPAVDRLLLALGVRVPQSSVESVSEAFGRHYTLETDAIWLISEGVVARDLATGLLATLDMPWRETLGPVGLTVRGGAETTPVVRRFADAVREVAASEAGRA
jgi:LysR family pca operon transcriptional activator